MKRLLNGFLAFILAIIFALSSVLPVQADTQLIGATIAGTTASAYQIIYQYFVASSSGTLNTIKVYGAANCNVKVGIYSVTGEGYGYPVTLLSANNTGVPILSGQWNTIPLSSSVSITAGTAYYLAAVSQAVNGIMFKTGTTTQYWYGDYTQTYSVGLVASPVLYSTRTTYEVSIQGWYIAPTVPIVTTSAATSILSTSAQLNGSQTTTGTCDYQGFVWGNVVHGDPGNVAPASSTYLYNWTESGTYASGSTFNYTPTTLISNTPYYFRACAHNTNGWAYGSELSFTTLLAITPPTISTVAATNIATTSAQLNASVTSSGGQLADVRWGYDNVTHSGNFTAYAYITAWENNTYNTGDAPFKAITGLNSNQTYFFNVQIENDNTTAYGTELAFATANGVNCPSSIVAIATSNSMSINFIKGSGSANTLVRYQQGSYPTVINEGSLAYLDTGESVNVTGLDPGTTYYISAWGLTSGIYSSTYITFLVTTQGYSAVPSSGTPAPATVNSAWWQMPDATKISSWPILGALFNLNYQAYKMPLAMIAYIFWMAVGVLGGIVLYNVTKSENLPAVFGAELIWFGFGAVLGLTMFWIVEGFLLIGMGFELFGHRR